MARTVRDVMSTDLVKADPETPLLDIARMMRDQGVGDVLVCDQDRLCGILTDRDIVVRALAEGLEIEQTTADDVYSGQNLATLTPDASLDDAEQIMRDRAVRRIPVCEGEKPVGIITLDDLALETGGTEDVLADIGVAPPNE